MTKEEILQEAVNAAPPATVSSMYVAGIALSNWVIILTLVYLLLQIGWFVYRHIKEIRDGSFRD